MIYLDNAATTKINEDVLQKMMDIMKNHFANPSSLYDLGLTSEKIITESRKQIAHLLKVQENEIYFTPSGTFGNNTAILGSLTDDNTEEFLLNPLEHSSVNNVYKVLSNKRKIQTLTLDANGKVNIEDLKRKINNKTRMVSIMHVNNEVGIINDLQEIGNVIKEHNPTCLFHVDGIQGFGKIPINLKNSKIDIYTASAHKIHGPKGIGLMYIKNNSGIKPIIFGGGQEHGFVSGTENIGFIYAFSECAKRMFHHMTQRMEYLIDLKKYMIDEILKIEDSQLLSSISDTSPYISFICFKDIMSEVLLHFLEQDKIYISTGSACSKGSLSSAIDVFNVEKSYQNGCIRISFSEYTTKEEVDIFIQKLNDYVKEIRHIVRRK